MFLLPSLSFRILLPPLTQQLDDSGAIDKSRGIKDVMITETVLDRQGQNLSQVRSTPVPPPGVDS